MPMNIRAAETKDLPGILAITNHAILHTTAIYEYAVRSPEFIEQWFKQKQAENMPVLVYELNNQAVGYGTYGIFRPRAAYQFSVEHSVYVHPDYQGQGIGKQLLAALINKARSEGYHTMIAGIDAANEQSCALHQKFGFSEVGRLREVGYKFDTWLDLVFMQLLLQTT